MYELTFLSLKPAKNFVFRNVWIKMCDFLDVKYSVMKKLT